MSFEEIFEVNLALGIKKESNKLAFGIIRRFDVLTHKQKFVKDKEMSRERWNKMEGDHRIGAILGFLASLMMFALVVFGVIIFSCAEGAESRDKSDDAADTTTYGGSACVAGCGAACGG